MRAIQQARSLIALQALTGRYSSSICAPVALSVNWSFASFINFTRTERKRPLAGSIYPPRFRGRVGFSLVRIGVRHGTACVLEGLPQAVPRLMSNCSLSAVPGLLVELMEADLLALRSGRPRDQARYSRPCRPRIP